ncbi:MAG: ABC transporter permease [Bdellovibrionaceae bacterium]|jgi:lipooligosaccharide transport system permease protein|nr:ABC transporter permease [Pseudobdellovibrionaceae bacterium]
MKNLLYSVLFLPSIKTIFKAQVKRNYLEFNKSFVQNVFKLLFQPLFIYLAIGYGLGQIIDPIRNFTYFEFVTPAVIILTGAYVSFKESFRKYYMGTVVTQNYQPILKTPMTEIEISFGEIMWATLKGCMSVSLILIFSLISKDITMPFNILILFYIFLNSFVASTFGVLFVKFFINKNKMNAFIIGFIIPLSLICGSFFPLTKLPPILKKVTLMFPPTHFIFLIRKSYFDLYYSTYFLSLGFCVFVGYLSLSYTLNKKSL